MSSGPVMVSAAPGARFAAARTSPGRMSVLLGMHPQKEHSPPTSSRSMMATRRPPSARRPAACSPAGPAPITSTSYVSATVIPPPPRSRNGCHYEKSRQAADCYAARLGAGDVSFRGPRCLERGVQGEAAVNEERLPGDVRGLVRAEEGNGGRHLVGAARPAHRDVAFHHAPLDGVVDPGPVDRGHGGARADAVDPYSSRGVLECERAGEVLHAALGHRIAEETRLGDHLVHAGYVDDDPGQPGGQEGLHGAAGAQECTAQVHRENLV